MPEKPQVVLDTNVFISALRSKRGASYRLLSLVGKGHFEMNVSVPLILEYEDVAKRQAQDITLSEEAIDDILDYLCLEARGHEIFYLWRPRLKDPEDDFLLELAVKASCDVIITYNSKDFAGIEPLGISVQTPLQFLQERDLLP